MLTESKETHGPDSKAQEIWRKTLSPSWLGQTVASLCWGASMLSYGVSSTGDWLQLLAASAWLFANLSALLASNTVSQHAL